jgi:hypothetical protein
MATSVYDIKNIKILDGTEIEISPLKIKYLREFMDKFENVKIAKGEVEAIEALSECAQVCMKQTRPDLANDKQKFEDAIDLETLYKILDVCAGIKINEKKDEPVKKQAVDSGSSWNDLDLATLEAEAFLLGIWKNYEELEISLCMSELLKTLEVSRESDYTDKKFSAAMQGVDLDANAKKTNAWEDMKARVFSDGAATDANDILAYQGPNAERAGFGIGLGLDYESVEG